jgi:D-tyrosyl-tRNA(Tyr) deacylase
MASAVTAVLLRIASMIALIQRVSQARVRVAGEVVGEIGTGLLALVCAERDDGEREADALLAKLLAYRVFPDEAGRMNRSLREVGGGLLVVSQFTLAADTNTGTRPSFTPAAPPELGQRLYDRFVAAARREHPVVATGTFGAMMQVELINDGPVTFWLQVGPKR